MICLGGLSMGLNCPGCMFAKIATLVPKTVFWSKEGYGKILQSSNYSMKQGKWEFYHSQVLEGGKPFS
jgi:hypothetical protein